jgi:hypothetical protein
MATRLSLRSENRIDAQFARFTIFQKIPYLKQVFNESRRVSYLFLIGRSRSILVEEKFWRGIAMARLPMVE